MGKFEEADSKKVLAGQNVMRGTSQPRSLKEFFLELFTRPYRAYKQRQREDEIRKSIITTTPDAIVPSHINEKDSWTYKANPQDEGRVITKDSWINDLIEEEDQGE